jgi:hypothetical protein
MPHAYTPAETTRIAARLDKLARSLSEPEHRLLAVFALAAEQVQAAPATGLRYVDKTTGSEVRLTPNRRSRWCARTSKTPRTPATSAATTA